MFNQLHEAIQWIESQIKFKPKTDLLRLKQAYDLLNLDLSKVKKIHVAGTNGKGSVCAYLSYILIEAGYQVGTYTSPYLLRFNERIKIQFEDIEDQELLDLIEVIYAFNLQYQTLYGETLSFFELITLMSLIHFEKKKVDIMIMEVGLGGLLDATNILNYDLSIITSIGFDHMKQLGNTLESIATNKLGIMKPGNHLISSVDPALHPFFKAYLDERNNTYEFYVKEDALIKKDVPLAFEFQGYTYQLPLLGEYQLLNAIVSIVAARYIDPEMTNELIQKGLSNTRWPGRMEMILPDVYIDGGHNTHAMEALKRSAKETFKSKKIWILFSALADKDINGMLDILKTFADRIVLTKFPDPRFSDLSLYLTENITWSDDPFHAINSMKQEMDNKTILIVTGSLHFIGYIKNHFV